MIDQEPVLMCKKLINRGINAPTKHRVSLRLRLQCAPIKQSEYMENYSGSNISSLFALTPSELAAYVFKEPIEDLAYESTSKSKDDR